MFGGGGVSRGLGRGMSESTQKDVKKPRPSLFLEFELYRSIRIELLPSVTIKYFVSISEYRTFSHLKIYCVTKLALKVKSCSFREQF